MNLRQCMQSEWLKDLACLLLGGLLALSFAPIHFYFLAWLIPGFLIPLWLYTTPKRAAFRGWLFACGLFGVGVSWVFVSIYIYGNTPSGLAALFTFLFIIVLALFYALLAGCYRLLFSKPSFSAWCLAFPALWVLIEWVRSWIFSGFPWLYLSYSQVDSLLSGFIPLLGVYGTLAILVMSNALLSYAILQRKPKYFLAVLMIFTIGYFSSFIHWTKPNLDFKTVSLIQGNIAQDKKWDKKFVNEIITRYTTLTVQHWDSDLIIWPEAALPLPLPTAQRWVDDLDHAAKKHHTTLLLGLMMNAKDDRFFNSILAIGEGEGFYHKRKLVPFGEYVPFENWLRNLIDFFNLPFSTIIPGHAEQSLLIIDNWKIAPLICYEIAYADLAEEAAREGNVLLTISNDAWFGRSWGPQQHLQIARFRALETGRYVIRATNNGLTAIIDEKGQVTAEIPGFVTDVLTAKVDTTQGKTPIIYLGYIFIILFLFLLLLVCIKLNFKKEK